ncbi:DUF2334 domain-containing protein [Listeria goaensis]|uniref:DUF2334 domain-containing protein n=1 Tax=Listeria goaensis TaxID=1649188 RepID=UPI000B589703|nr:DUF2334 domain-containing protein [Listeria goaensis]
MFKKCFLVLLFVSSICLWPAPGEAAKAGTTLVLYDSLAKQDVTNGNVDLLLRMLASYGQTVRLQDVHEKLEADADFIIVVQNKTKHLDSKISEKLQQSGKKILFVGQTPPDWAREKLGNLAVQANDTAVSVKVHEALQSEPLLLGKLNLIQAAEGHKMGEVTTDTGTKFPYAVRNGNVSYASFLVDKPVSGLALFEVLNDFYGAKQTGKPYVVIRDVNPFVNFEMVQQTADAFYEAGIPFIVSAGPVFENMKLNAAKKYAQLLQYVETRGGSIILNAPVVTFGESKKGELTDVMATSIHFFAENEIAPLGISSEAYWQRDKIYRDEGLAPFSSAILFPNKNIVYTAETNQTNAFQNALFYLDGKHYAKWAKNAEQTRFVVDTALGFSLFSDEAELKKAVEWLQKLPIQDYADLPHAVQTEKDKITAQNGFLYVNGREISPQDESDTMKQTEATKQEASLNEFFSTQSKVLTVIILATLLVFVILFLIGYRVYRKKYVK